MHNSNIYFTVHSVKLNINLINIYFINLKTIIYIFFSKIFKQPQGNPITALSQNICNRIPFLKSIIFFIYVKFGNKIKYHSINFNTKNLWFICKPNCQNKFHHTIISNLI